MKLSEVHLRIAGVTIEHLPWQQFIKTYDKPGTLYYLDPPYYKAPCYKHNFELNDFQNLAAALADLKSRFILSINDHPEMRAVFKAFEQKPLNLTYSAAKAKCTTGSELLICN